MASSRIEVGTRHQRQNWGGVQREFDKKLPSVVFKAVSQLAGELGVELRELKVIESKPKAR